MSSDVPIRVASKTDRQKALGDSNEKRTDFIFDHKFLESFDDLPLPENESDWLAQYAEKGQTYQEFVQVSRTLESPASVGRTIIYLTLFGSLETFLFDMNSLTDYTQRYFQMPVKQIDLFTNIHRNEETHEWKCKYFFFSFDCQNFVYVENQTGTLNMNNNRTRNFNIRTRYDETSKRCQIRVHGILNLLKKVVPNDGKCLIALSMYDLYDGDSDLFIAGLSLPNNRVAAFSLFRYDPYLKMDESNWFEYTLTVDDQSTDKSNERQRSILLRACRLLTHEICHLFGIAHCIFFACLMNGSGNLGKVCLSELVFVSNRMISEEDFRQPLLECPIDLRKLRSLLCFDGHRRYEDLLEFFRAQGFDSEAKMLEDKLIIINELVTRHPCSLDNNLKRKLADSDVEMKSTPYSLRKRKSLVNRTIKVHDRTATK